MMIIVMSRERIDESWTLKKSTWKK